MQLPKQQILKIGSVVHAYGLSRATIYRLIKLGLFPKPIKIGLAAVGFDADALALWYEQRKAV